MPLSSKQRRQLKSDSHHLKAIIRIGQHGVSEPLIAETNNALHTHELIKVQIQQGERADRISAAEKLCQATKAELIHHIGKMFIIYRKSEKDT
ncbi:MAG: ribosome assembly RNA-binding protein YhbY [Mariprofundaceae bacterium]